MTADVKGDTPPLRAPERHTCRRRPTNMSDDARRKNAACHGCRITRMFKRTSLLLAVLALFAPLAAQQRMDADINAKIRQEENSHSQIMRTLHFLTEVYGPRLTGTPSMKAAGEWSIKTMESWGFANGHLEPWDYGHPGWVNERFTGHIVAPVKDQ